MKARDVFAAAFGRRNRSVAACALALPAFLGIGASTAFAVPVPSIDPVGPPTITTAKVSGEIVTDEASETYWGFQYRPVLEGEAAANQGPEDNWANGPGAFAAPLPPETTNPVEETLTGLRADTEYEVRLFAFPTSDFTFVYAPPSGTPGPAFTTDPAPNAPTLTVDPVAAGYLEAHLSGEVDPEGGNVDTGIGPVPIFWQLQYTTDPVVEGWQFAGAGTIEGAEAESDPAPGAGIAVSADVAGLQPGTEYSFRLLATYASQEAAPAEADFTTKAVAPPEIQGLAVSALTSNSAHFAAEVDPNAPDENANLDADAKAAFDTEWSFTCVPACTVGPKGGTVLADNAAHPVAENATSLEPNVDYVLTITAQSKGGTDTEQVPFTPDAVPPSVTTKGAHSPSPSEATLNGVLNPHNSPTVYWFEWGTGDCAANPCTAVPLSEDADAGSGGQNKFVSEEISGLEEGVTYHYRLVADNGVGAPVAGDDVSFTTAPAEPACANEAIRSEQHSTFLPDCRAYEMVSPPDKDGADVMAASSRTHVAVEGDAVAFASLGGFADTQGSGVAFEYLSERTAAPGGNGWATHAITPRQSSLGIGGVFAGGDPLYAEFSDDLSRGVYRAYRPLTDAPNVANNPNLYLRGGLLAPGAITTELIGDASTLQPPSSNRPLIADSTPDLSHVVYEACRNLTEGAIYHCPDNPFLPNIPNLYEWDGSGLRLVGRVPASDVECDDLAGPACQAAAGSQASFGAYSPTYTPRIISDDGRHIFFQDQSTGIPYARIDGHRTLQLNVSEKTVKETAQAASFWTASADGTRAFITTDEGLVAGDDDGASDLYMYDFDKPSGSRLTLISVDDAPADGSEVRNVIGASANGHYVYFASQGQLVSGEPAMGGLVGLYLWHDGTITFVGRFIGSTENSSDVAGNSLNRVWAFPFQVSDTRVAADGQLLFRLTDASGFAGRSGFAGYDHGKCTLFNVSGSPCRELYLYDPASAHLACVSCNPTGAAATVDAFTWALQGSGAASGTSHLSHALSADGRWVFFSTAERLSEADTNSVSDAYAYDARTGTPRLLSSGTDPDPSYFLEASPDGHDVFIATREQLAAWDFDRAYDLYDARVGGGLPEPAAVPTICSGDNCQGAQTPAPTPQGSGTAGFSGEGDPPPPRRCPKGTHPVKAGNGKTRCAKNRKHGRKHGNRTNSDRRAAR